MVGLTREVKADVALDRSRPRMLEPDTEERLHESMREHGFTDQLPIVLPTEPRVEAMLAGTSKNPDQIVGSMSANSRREAWGFTVEKVAVNAVMAGARPEYLPSILALASTGVSARDSSTSSLAGMALFNGPVRAELGLGSGVGAGLTTTRTRRSVETRSLLSQNLQGGSTPGLTYMGSQGNAHAFSSMCFAENEELNPWEPFHVEHGFRDDESVVSAFIGGRTVLFSIGLSDTTWAPT